MGWAYADAEKLQWMVFIILAVGAILAIATSWLLYRLIRRIFRKK